MFGNTITIVGNLTRDPELRYTQNGTALAKLGVAWNRRYQKNGQEVEDVSYFNITCWGTLGENVANSNIQKGSRVVVVGRLDQQRYETREGDKRSSVEIIADEVSPSLTWATVEITKTAPSTPKEHSQETQTAPAPAPASGTDEGEEPF